MSASAPFSMQDLGAQVVPAAATVGKRLSVTITGYTALQTAGGSLMQPTTNELQVSLSHAVGRHLIRFGSGIEHTNDYTFNHNANEAGAWSFSAARTTSASVPKSGDAVGSFLLGLPATFTQASADPWNFVMTTFDPWVQDDWKVSSRLTLNLGLRWEPSLQPRDTAGFTSGFDPGVQSVRAPLSPRSIVFGGDPGIPQSIVRNYWKVFSPRVGFAWNLGSDAKTVLRAGYGIFRIGSDFDGLIRNLDAPPSRTLSVSIPNPPSIVNPYARYSRRVPVPLHAACFARAVCVSRQCRGARARCQCASGIHAKLEFHGGAATHRRHRRIALLCGQSCAGQHDALPG